MLKCFADDAQITMLVTKIKLEKVNCDLI